MPRPSSPPQAATAVELDPATHAVPAAQACPSLLPRSTTGLTLHVRTRSMFSAMKMQLLALALCLCHASAFAGVITARGSVNTMGMQQGDQRLANAAVRRGRDVMDKLGEHCFILGWGQAEQRARHTQGKSLVRLIDCRSGEAHIASCSSFRACCARNIVRPKHLPRPSPTTLQGGKNSSVHRVGSKSAPKFAVLPICTALLDPLHPASLRTCFVLYCHMLLLSLTDSATTERPACD